MNRTELVQLVTLRGRSIESAIAAATKQVQGDLCQVYAYVHQRLEEEAGGLPIWMVRNGDGRIVFNPGNATQPAILLDKTGRLYEVDRTSIEGIYQDKPLEGIAYLTAAKKGLDNKLISSV